MAIRGAIAIMGAFLLCDAVVFGGEPRTIHVSAAFGNDQNMGTADQPVATIQRGIELASDSDTVLVADGAYLGQGNTGLDFRGKAILVRSENGPASCFIDSDGSGSGVVFHTQEGRDSILEGFTICGGRQGLGAGILCTHGSSPTIRGNIIRDNHSGDDEDCGAGIACWDRAAPLILANIIEENSCEPGGAGAAIRCYEAGDVEIIGNIIRRNLAWQAGGISIMNPLAERFYRIRVENNLIYDNSASSTGAISCSGSGLTIIRNNTLADNQNWSTAGGIDVIGQAVLEGNILWGNLRSDEMNEEAQVWIAEGGSATFRYNCLQGWTGSLGGAGNFDADPAFADPGWRDYHLASEAGRWDAAAGEWVRDSVTSPCIDAGNPGRPLGDEPLTLLADPQNEYGANVRINLGAYGGTAEASMAPHGWMLLADMDNDGQAALSDFALLAALWMQQEDALWADLSRDGRVDLADLELLAGVEWLGRALGCGGHGERNRLKQRDR